MSSRATHGEYADPIDLIWLDIAQELGFRIHRSDEAYASFDGCGRMTICTDAEFDPDDSLAQMILHEICHALVGGRNALKTPDWGLTSDQGDDLNKEHATHRLQASFCDKFGLRELFAVTTQWRPHYDSLGPEPLRGDKPSVAMAKQGLENARAWNWENHILRGLKATAAVAEIVRPFAPVESTWRSSRPLHPTGFILEGSHHCGDCAWFVTSPNGEHQCQHRCTENTPSISLEPSCPSCQRFEARFSPEECARCGACCREGFDAVPVGSEEPLRQLRPELLETRGNFTFIPRPGGRCAGLRTGSETHWRCDIYEDRPQSCRELEIGSSGCLQARQRVGLTQS